MLLTLRSCHQRALVALAIAGLWPAIARAQHARDEPPAAWTCVAAKDVAAEIHEQLARGASAACGEPVGQVAALPVVARGVLGALRGGQRMADAGVDFSAGCSADEGQATARLALGCGDEVSGFVVYEQGGSSPSGRLVVYGGRPDGSVLVGLMDFVRTAPGDVVQVTDPETGQRQLETWTVAESAPLIAAVRERLVHEPALTWLACRPAARAEQGWSRPPVSHAVPPWVRARAGRGAGSGDGFR